MGLFKKEFQVKAVFLKNGNTLVDINLHKLCKVHQPLQNKNMYYADKEQAL